MTPGVVELREHRAHLMNHARTAVATGYTVRASNLVESARKINRRIVRAKRKPQ